MNEYKPNFVIESVEVSDEILKKAKISDEDLKKGLSGDQINDIATASLSDYYKKWLDLPIPGLKNMTPREASKTKDGVDLLNALFVHMKSLNVPASLRPDFNSIKKELGID